jgi:hypothetical protein
MASRIEDLLDQWEPTVRAAFLAAVYSIRDSAQIGVIIARLEKHDIDGAIRAVGLDPIKFRPLDTAIAQAYEAGGSGAVRDVPSLIEPDGFRLNVVFDPSHPRAAAWLREHGLTLITQITDDQREMVRGHLNAALESGQNERTVALDLVGRVNRATGHREGGVIGLTTTQEQWARNYAAELATPDTAEQSLVRNLRDRRFDAAVRRSVKDGKPIPAETREKMVTAYRNRALRYRAETIGRTETLTALHQASNEMYQQAIDEGVITEAQVRRFWVTAGDERVRATHRLIPGMNSGGVGLNQQFITPDGPFLFPPAGPNCRCHVRVQIQDAA